MAEIREFIIFIDNKKWLEEKIGKLNKKAIRLNLNPIYLQYGETSVKTIKTINELGKEVSADFVVQKIILTGPVNIKFDGWEFLATIQHLPDNAGNIFRQIVGTENISIPEVYRDVGPNCDHCNTNRYRNDTYILFHESSGMYTQVGSSCLKDFIGNSSPDKLVSIAEFLNEFSTIIHSAGNHELFGGIRRETSSIPLEEFLANTNAIIRNYGWRSKSACKDGGYPTSHLVATNLRIYNKPFQDFFYVDVTEQDYELAKKAIEYVENISDKEVADNSYLYNIRTIAQSGLVLGYRLFGFAASIVSAYNRELANRERLASITKSEWIGSLKERRIFDLTLTRTFINDSYYGKTWKYIFHDMNGNIFTWNSSSNHDLKEGYLYIVKGSIKAHAMYKDIKQTVLTRCDVTKLFD